MPDNLPSAHPVPEPHPVPSPPPLTEVSLEKRLHGVVVGIAGVGSLVPSMKTAVQRLRQDGSSAPTQPEAGVTDNSASQRPGHPDPDASGDGITVTLHGGAVTAVLDITAVPTASVLHTALAVHSAALKMLNSIHAGRHTVRVNVLGLGDVPIVPHPVSPPQIRSAP